jgi:O-antigen ligase
MFAAFLGSVFWRPTLGIYLLVLTLPLQTGRYLLQGFPLGAQFVDILLLGVILGLLIQKKLAIPKTNLNGFLLLFAVFCYFSLWEGSFFLNAPLPLWIGDPRFATWKNYVEMFLLALVVAAAVKEKSQIRLLLICMALSVLIVNRSYYSTLSGRDLSHFSYDVRDAGPLGYAGVNGLAAFEAMAASFLLGIFTFAKKIQIRLGLLLLVATCCYCLLFSFSRGGYAGIFVGLITVGLLRSRWMLVAAAVILLGWQTLLPSAVKERILMTTGDAQEGQQFDSSAQTRLVLWEDAMDLFKRNPLTGTGFETFSHLGHVSDLRDTHNYYVKVLAETGVVGLMLYLILLWRMSTAGMRLFYSTDDPFWRGLGLGFIALMASIVVMNLFGDRWTYQQVDGLIWILLGCVIRGLATISEQLQPAGTPARAEVSDRHPAELAAV